jgi:hypothetical protein
MICEYYDRVWVPFEVVTPFREGANDCKEFAIKNLVVAFGRVQGL